MDARDPLVCVEVDEVVSPEEWASVIVFGRYEELPDSPEYQPQRAALTIYCKPNPCGGSPVM